MKVLTTRDAVIENVSKVIRNHILGSIAVVKAPEKKSPLAKRHIMLRLQWGQAGQYVYEIRIVHR